MDVLRPALININGRIYRRNPVKEEHYEDEEEEAFSYSGPVSDQCMDEPCDTSNIEQTDQGFRCAIEVPSVLYKYIIGKKGETRRRLEAETKTTISIPKQGVEGQIVITGSHKAAVASAVTRVEVLIESFRRKQPFSHFLSFALNHPPIQEGFKRFKGEVLDHCSQDMRVDASIFQNHAKLHLTIGTLALLNEQEVMRASELLTQCQGFIRDITEGKPLALEVKGIEYMNDDPSMVDVLYAKVCVQDGSDKLQQIADRLVECFVAAGLMVKEWDRVKLHATVMNTLFRKDPSAEDKGGAGRPSVKDREAFDARNILESTLQPSLQISLATTMATLPHNALRTPKFCPNIKKYIGCSFPGDQINVSTSSKLSVILTQSYTHNAYALYIKCGDMSDSGVRQHKFHKFCTIFISVMFSVGQKCAWFADRQLVP